jgi:hypothetical protein
MARLIFPFTLHIEGEANGDATTQEVNDTQELSQVLKESLDLTQPDAEENLVEGILEGERMRVGETMVYGTQS